MDLSALSAEKLPLYTVLKRRATLNVDNSLLNLNRQVMLLYLILQATWIHSIVVNLSLAVPRYERIVKLQRLFEGTVRFNICVNTPRSTLHHLPNLYKLKSTKCL